MSDGSIKITGDLKFIGYKQKANPGVNQQVLTYLNGEAVWSDRPGAINIVTSPVSNTVMTDNAGNVYTFDNETYPELRTTPIQEVESAPADSGGGDTIFLSSVCVDGEVEIPGTMEANIPPAFDGNIQTGSGGGTSTDILGRLEVNVVNNSGSALAQYSAYSLEDNAYDLPTNTVTLTSTRTGIPTQGQTALFFCQEAIADGTTGVGIIKGLVTTTVLSSVDSERDLKVLPSGSLSDIILEGEYVVATVTRSPLLDTPLEIAFDGLSNYKFTTSSGGVTFLSTQTEYDAQIWNEGDIFIPTSNNIEATVSPTNLVVKLTPQTAVGGGSPRADFDSGILDTELNTITGTFFTVTNATTTGSFGIVALGELFFSRKGVDTDGDIQPSVGRLELLYDNTLTTNEEFAQSWADTINSIPTDVAQTYSHFNASTGFLTSTLDVLRTCTATVSGDVLTITADSPGNASPVQGTSVGEINVEIIPGLASSTFDFIEFTLYIRNGNNDGWLGYSAPTENFIEE